MGKSSCRIIRGCTNRKSKGAQEAHEAIRPTAVGRTPESIKVLFIGRSGQTVRSHLAALHGQPDVRRDF